MLLFPAWSPNFAERAFFVLLLLSLSIFLLESANAYQAFVLTQKNQKVKTQ